MDVETPLHPYAVHQHREFSAQSITGINGKQEGWVVQCRCGRFMRCFG